MSERDKFLVTWLLLTVFGVLIVLHEAVLRVTYKRIDILQERVNVLEQRQ